MRQQIMSSTAKKEESGIISWFAQNPVAANLLLISMIVLGLLTVNHLRTETFPSLPPDTVTISVTYKSGDAEQSEEGVGLKIEEALETVQGIKRMTTTSNASGSTVVVEMMTNYSLDTLWDDIKTEVDAINSFPDGAENPVIEKATRQSHAITIELFGDSDRNELQPLAKQLKSALLSLSEVHDLTMDIELDPMIYIDINEDELQAYGLSFSDISSTINAESSSAKTTSLRNPSKTVRLKIAQQKYTPSEFANIVVKTQADGSQVRLGDIATLSNGFDDTKFSLSRFNGQSSVGIEILMNENSDITKIVPQVEQLVAEWRTSNILPSNVSIDTWYDRSVMIKARLDLLLENALYGVVLVFVMLALFLNLQVALWVVAGLPFIFLGTLFFMSDSYLGLSLNSMTTFGFIMALGIVVDDAVVIGESIYSTRKDRGDTIHNTILGVMKVAVPTIFGVLTTVAAFMAISNVEGKMGELYAQFAMVVTVCLILSLIESKLILPAHLAHINTHRDPNKGGWTKIQHAADSALMWFRDRLYKPAIEVILNFRYAVILVFVAVFIFVIDMPLNGTLRVTFFPSIPGDTIRGEFNMYQDSSYGQTQTNLNHMEELAYKAENQMRNKFDLEKGSPVIDDIHIKASSDTAGKITITLVDDLPFSASEFSKVWQKLVGNLDGAKDVAFRTERNMGDNFRVELKGWYDSSVVAAANEFKVALAGINGVSGIQDNLDNTQPQYRFELTELGHSLGLDTSSLSSQIYQAFGGSTTQSFQKGKDEIDVKVRYPDKDRQSLADVLNSMIRLNDGTSVPLSSVAKVSFIQQQISVTRIDGLRASYVTAVVDKEIKSPTELVNQMRLTLVPQLLEKYPDLKISFAGEAEHQEEAMTSMVSMFVMAMLAIYALLAIPLKSYVQPILIMMAIPFGIVGAMLGHWGNDLAISILSLNGIIALSGVVVNDSLLLVSTYNRLRRVEKLNVHDAIVSACTGRLRAVLLTSFTTYAGLVPLLGETDRQAQFLIPAAASLGYGILFAVFITLVLIPALLKIYEEINAVIQNLINKVKV